MFIAHPVSACEIEVFKSGLPFYVHLQNCERELLALSYLFICVAVCLRGVLNNLASTGWILIKFDVRGFLKIYQNLSLVKISRVTGTLHEDLCIFFLRMKNFSFRVVGKIKTSA